MALATMKRWLERYPEGRRAHRLLLEPASYTLAALQPWFHTVEGRRQWLEPVVAADAEVLVDTGRETLLACDAQEGVVGLKAFRMGPQPMLALDLSTWAASPRDLPATAASLQQALTRLKALL